MPLFGVKPIPKANFFVSLIPIWRVCQMLTLRSIDVDQDSQKTGLWILSYQGSEGLNKILPLKEMPGSSSFMVQIKKMKIPIGETLQIGMSETKKFAFDLGLTPKGNIEKTTTSHCGKRKKSVFN